MMNDKRFTTVSAINWNRIQDNKDLESIDGELLAAREDTVVE